MIQIKKVTVKEDYKVEVMLDNGSSIILNLAERLVNIRFGRLADKLFFQKVTTDGVFLRWEDAVEISLSEVIQLAQK